MKTFILATATLVAGGCNCGQPTTSAGSRTTQSDLAQADNARAPAGSWVGQRGPDGPVGEQGPQGSTGQTGLPGYARAGPRGPAGPAGPMGEPGEMGAQGPSGQLAVGPMGPTGPAGGSGAHGGLGQTGAGGASADGYAGAQGVAGAQGAQGPTGETGATGPTLVGPAGPMGRAGQRGPQGEVGRTGAQGATTPGVAGPIGGPGEAGSPGPMGPTGPEGVTGVVEAWTSYRDFWFEADRAVIHPADFEQVAEMAAYMKANPSLVLGIDGSTNPRTMQPQAQDLNNRRIDAVRNALIAAGVPAARLDVGTHGNADLRREGRVEVLLKTNQLAQAPFRNVAGTNWTHYQDSWFADRSEAIHPADASKISDIAADMNQDPSLRIGIDNASHGLGADEHTIELASHRADAVHDALIAAGAPASRIEQGKFGDDRECRDGQVRIFARTE